MLRFKQTLQVALVREAGLAGDIGHAHGRLAQQSCCTLQAQIAQIITESPPCRFLEKRTKSARAHSHESRHLRLSECVLTTLSHVF